MDAKPKIYVFCNSCAPEWHGGVALAEDGHALAGHLSSGHGWLQHDMGIGSDWKHDAYNAHFPGGWELEWVESPLEHAGLRAALEKNQELGRAAAQ